MERTPGALLSTREIVAGDRLRYSPSVRRLMGCPGRGSVPSLGRIDMHYCCNTVGWPSACTFIALTRAIASGPVRAGPLDREGFRGVKWQSGQTLERRRR